MPEFLLLGVKSQQQDFCLRCHNDHQHRAGVSFVATHKRHRVVEAHRLAPSPHQLSVFFFLLDSEKFKFLISEGDAVSVVELVDVDVVRD